MGDVQGVKRTLDKYFEAFTKRDTELISQVLSNDENLFALGTDEEEVWRGWDSVRNAKEKQFEAITECQWERGETTINFSHSGNVAWFAEEKEGSFVVKDQHIKRDFRFTGVVEQRDGRWVIVQFHRSCPVKECAVPYLETHGTRGLA